MNCSRGMVNNHIRFPTIIDYPKRSFPFRAHHFIFTIPFLYYFHLLETISKIRLFKFNKENDLNLKKKFIIRQIFNNMLLYLYLFFRFPPKRGF